MTIADAFIAEIQAESAKTRALLERIPNATLDWRPHEKSMTLGQLASHLVSMLRLGISILEQEEFVFDIKNFKPYLAANTKELLEQFDKNLAETLKSFQGRADRHFATLWRMKRGDKVMLEMPRAAAIRYILLNHGYHHRGQLTVYLRLNNVPLPSIYGPSADETGAS